jgi:hypothetical protein
MIQKEDIEKVQSKITEEIHADSVFRDIEAREKERSKYEKRWFWELLQNAKDSITKKEKIKVRIEISDTQISFSHTGNPFELRDILSLIIQGSSKDDKEEKTGRFGTGFMTTYLLSKEVEIAGTLSKEQGYFKFTLNRNATTKEAFRLLQVQSNDNFKASISPNSYLGAEEYQTSFTYRLNDKGRETAEIGLKCLDELIPVTQLFNEQIEAVTVIENNNTKQFLKSFIKTHEFDGVSINEWTITSEFNGTPNVKFNAYVLESDNYETCLITYFVDGVETIFPLTDNFPRIFFTFPLIGTEEIGIPIILNSTKLDPRIERDGVYLKKTSDDNDESQNKDIIHDSLVNSIANYAILCSTKNIKGLYELFNFKKSKDYDWIDHDWFDNLKNEVISTLCSLEIIQPNNTEETKTSLNRVIIPYAKTSEHRLQLWNLITKAKDLHTPKVNEIESWVSVIENVTKLNRKIDEPYQLSYVWGVLDIVRFVERTQCKDDLEEALLEDIYTWLNRLYSVILNQQSSFSLSYGIVLNQKNNLRKAEGMYWDKCKDNTLISISNLTNLKYSEHLISEGIKCFDIMGVEDFTLQQAINELKSKLNDLNESDFINSNYLECSAEFLKWLITKQQKETIKELKVLTGESKRSDETFIYDHFPKTEHLLLSPKIYFESKFPLYSNLIRERDCLNDGYNEYLADDDYKFLAECGLINLEPVIIKNELATLNSLELLVKSESDLNLFRDNEGLLKQKFKISYTDFAYLTATNGNIYDRNKTQKSSLERLKFLLQEAVEKDPFFETDSQLVNIDGIDKPIEIRQCMWIYRAKRLNWINIRTDGESSESKFISETPSSKNLSELLKADELLIKEIKGTKQQLLLNRLGVGVSDLIRNTLPSDELRLSWDKAITNMITSDADPELVQEIFNDPNIKKEYERRLRERKIINRNQHIGQLIEELFKHYIEQLKNDGYLINIERKPFGSDYIITEESSDLVNNDNQREGFKINNWLVELKATGKDYAAMTPLQAKTASSLEYKDAYALIVIPLTGSEPDIDYVKNNARVINDIGYKIENVINDFNEVEVRKSSLYQGKDGISVNIEEQNIRFKVDSSVWVTQFTTIESFIQTCFITNSIKRNANE